MPSTPDQKITISSGELHIGSDVVVPYEIVRRKFPKFAEALGDTDFNRKVKSLKWFPGDEDNYIEFSDGGKYELPVDGEIFDRICSERYAIKFEQTEEVFTKKHAVEIVYKITLVNILEAPIHTRDALVREYRIERNGIDAPTNQQWLRLTKKTCKQRLYLSDWTQLLDVQEGFTEEERNFWKDYRAKLRDCMKADDPYKQIVIPAVPPGSKIESS